MLLDLIACRSSELLGVPDVPWGY